MQFFRNFWRDQDGAITVDFVALTAAIVTLGMVVGATISSGAISLADDISDNMEP